MIELAFVLPWPPSTNEYWMVPRNGPLAGRRVLTKKARDYEQAAKASLIEQGIAGLALTCKLEVEIIAREPNRIRRDISNLLKIVEDSLVHANVIEDDWLIDDLRIRRGPLHRPDGVLEMFVRQIEAALPRGEQIDLLAG